MRLPSNITIPIAALAWTAACGGQTPIQPPPPPPTLQLACPAPLVREATTPDGTDVHWEGPTASGGRPPYAVQCTPGSGSIFAIGESTVRCTASDADMAQASCGFSVAVRASRTLGKTTFVAFGDSITEGKISLAPLISLAEPETYPFKLEQMLEQRYPSQDLTVLNRGKSGERTDQGAQRLPGVLDADKPDVVLVLEGVNAVWLLPTSQQANAIRSMILAAKARHVDVILATVMPVSPVWATGSRAAALSRIRDLNARIVEMAAELEIGPVVDLFALFEANMFLLGADGLHPTVEGQTRIAEAFRDEIVRRYDMSSTATRRYSTMGAR